MTRRTNDGVEDELILTTLNGDLVVYGLALSGGAVTLGSLLYWDVFDGALGADGSILVRPGALYVAGSMGMRKFTFTP